MHHPIPWLYVWASKHHGRVKCGSWVKDRNMVRSSVLWTIIRLLRSRTDSVDRLVWRDVRFTAVLEVPISAVDLTWE